MKTLVELFLSESTKLLRLVLLTIYVLLSVAFYLRSDNAHPDMHLIFTALPLYGWESVCLVLAVFRWLDLFWCKSTPWSRRMTASVGIVIWSFLFVSAWKVEPFGMSILYIVPALLETWLLARAFYEHTLGID